MKIVSGDLIKLAEEGQFDFIVHGCNCFCVMGGGIARQLADKYPQVSQADHCTKAGDMVKLGNYTSAKILTEDNIVFYVINAYTQYKPSYKYDVFEYVEFKNFLSKFTSFLWYHTSDHIRKCRIGFPMIGAGLAGGDWSRILPMIEDFANQVEEYADVTIVEYLPNT
jgi:O-acetyl-ADP-ribose deacetylase (regulator of RNase III)